MDGEYTAELVYSQDFPFKIESNKAAFLIVSPKPLVLKAPAKFSSSLKAYQDNVFEQAFDKDGALTYFWSDSELKEGDHFTVDLEKPADAKTVKVVTGCAEHKDDFLHDGILEASEDGTTYTKVADFKDGVAEAEIGRQVKSIRIKCTKAQTFWLVITDVEVK